MIAYIFFKTFTLWEKIMALTLSCYQNKIIKDLNDTLT